MSLQNSSAPGTQARRPAPRGNGLRQGAIASRAVAGILGGYGLMALFSVVLALASRAPREDAVLLGTTPAYLVFVATLVWAFAAKTAGRVWLGLLASGALLVVAYWLLRHGASAAGSAAS